MLNAVVNEKDGWIIIRPNNNIEFRSLTRDLFSLLLVIDCDRIINLMIFFFSHTWRDCVPIGPFKNDLDFTALLFSFDVVYANSASKNKIATQCSEEDQRAPLSIRTKNSS